MVLAVSSFRAESLALEPRDSKSQSSINSSPPSTCLVLYDTTLEASSGHHCINQSSLKRPNPIHSLTAQNSVCMCSSCQPHITETILSWSEADLYKSFMNSSFSVNSVFLTSLLGDQ